MTDVKITERVAEHLRMTREYYVKQHEKLSTSADAAEQDMLMCQAAADGCLLMIAHIDTLLPKEPDNGDTSQSS